MTVLDINPFIRFFTLGHLQNQDTVKTNDCRMFYCISGYMNITAGDKAYTLTPGDLITFPGGTPYTLTNCNGSFYIINFDYTCDISHMSEGMRPIPIDIWSEEDLIRFEEITDESELNQVFFCKNVNYIENDLKEFNSEFRRKDMNNIARASGIFKKIIIDILRTKENKSQKTISQEKLISYIRENYTRDISNEEIGKVFGYNPCYLNRLLQEYTGMTVRQYILECRLDKAMRLLAYDDTSVTDIAESLGFCSASHFISFFKSRTGKTPLQYRSDILI